MFTLFNIVIGVVMIGCFVGMILCAKKQHSNALAKPLAIVLLLGVVVCTVLILTKSLGSGDTRALIANELRFAKASSYILGKKLAEIKPGAKVLVIVDEQNEMNKRQKILIDGLKEGFGSAITSVTIKTPQIKKAKGAPQEMMMPLMEMVKAADFNKLLKQNKSCNLIVTMIGLPMDMGGLTIWDDFDEDPKKTPKLAILNGDVSMLGMAIKSGLVPAAVTHNPDARYTEDAAPEDMQAAFDVRYLLITTKNVDEILKKYGDKVFRKPK